MLERSLYILIDSKVSFHSTYNMNSYDISNISFPQVLTATFALFAVIDILGSLPVLISLKNKMGGISSARATLVSGMLILLFFFLGEKFLGIWGLM